MRHTVQFPLTVRARLGRGGNHNTRGSTGGSASRSTDVAQKVLLRNGSLGLDIRVDRPLDDVAVPLFMQRIRQTEHGLEGGAHDEERRDEMHGEVGQGTCREVCCVGDQAGGEIMVAEEDLLEVIYCVHVVLSRILMGDDLVLLSLGVNPLWRLRPVF